MGVALGVDITQGFAACCLSLLCLLIAPNSRAHKTHRSAAGSCQGRRPRRLDRRRLGGCDTNHTHLHTQQQHTDEPLGPVWDAARGAWTVAVWAPTATSVQLLQWRAARGGEAGVHDMKRGQRGVWSFEAPADWDRR